MASIKCPTAYQMRLLLGSLFALVVADGLITSFLVQFDLAWEGNPFLQGLVGGQYFMTVKVVGAAAIVFLLWSTYRRRPALAAITTIAGVTFYTVVVYWNIFSFIVSQI